VCQIRTPGGPFDGRTITVTRLSDIDFHEPHWEYEGKPFTLPGQRFQKQVTFYDRVLIPLTPPPGAQGTQECRELRQGEPA
jgi:hypothetical protein